MSGECREADDGVHEHGSLSGRGGDLLWWPRLSPWMHSCWELRCDASRSARRKRGGVTGGMHTLDQRVGLDVLCGNVWLWETLYIAARLKSESVLEVLRAGRCMSIGETISLEMKSRGWMRGQGRQIGGGRRG